MFSQHARRIEGTPIAGNGYDGFYVLDFFMSPPATATPEAYSARLIA